MLSSSPVSLFLEVDFMSIRHKDPASQRYAEANGARTRTTDIVTLRYDLLAYVTHLTGSMLFFTKRARADEALGEYKMLSSLPSGASITLQRFSELDIFPGFTFYSLQG